MYGAILGDIIGSPYEFDQGDKTKEFPLFCKRSQYTDDSVMTVAVAEALLVSMGKDEAAHKAALVASMQKWGHAIPDAGYGGMFYQWLRTEDPKPYGSFGNGSAMRVSAAGWLYGTLEETREKARWTAEVTHNHPEGIKGAEATAAAIFLGRTGHSKEEIRDYIISEFGYDLSRTCDEIRPGYHHVETCQETVPEAITAFMEGKSFIDVIRTAVSLGGDCDTLTCIAGSIAEAFYGVPEELKEECRKRIEPEMLEVLERFDEIRTRMAEEQDGKYASLARIIPRLENSKYGDWAEQHGDGSEKNPFTLPFVLYTSEIRQLEDAIYDYHRKYPEENLNNYGGILEESGIQWNTESMEKADVSAMDGRTVVALLTGAIRAERFCDGALLDFCKSGAVLRWLKRLKEIDNGE